MPVSSPSLPRLREGATARTLSFRETSSRLNVNSLRLKTELNQPEQNLKLVMAREVAADLSHVKNSSSLYALKNQQGSRRIKTLSQELQSFKAQQLSVKLFGQSNLDKCKRLTNELEQLQTRITDVTYENNCLKQKAVALKQDLVTWDKRTADQQAKNIQLQTNLKRVNAKSYGLDNQMAQNERRVLSVYDQATKQVNQGAKAAKLLRDKLQSKAQYQQGRSQRQVRTREIIKRQEMKVNRQQFQRLRTKLLAHKAIELFLAEFQEVSQEKNRVLEESIQKIKLGPSQFKERFFSIQERRKEVEGFARRKQIELAQQNQRRQRLVNRLKEVSFQADTLVAGRRPDGSIAKQSEFQQRADVCTRRLNRIRDWIAQVSSGNSQLDPADRLKGVLAELRKALLGRPREEQQQIARRHATRRRTEQSGSIPRGLLRGR